MNEAHRARFMYWAKRRWACLDKIRHAQEDSLIDAGYCLDRVEAA